MFAAWLALLSSCGNDGPTTTEADGGIRDASIDAPADAPPPNTTHRGLVQAVHFPAANPQLGGGFYEAPSSAPGCRWTFAGPCSMAACEADAGLVAVSAGTLTATFDQTIVTLTPNAMARYATADTLPALPPGTMMTVSAEGSTVAAFSSPALTMPALIEVATPTTTLLLRNQPLSVRWTAVAGSGYINISQNVAGIPYPEGFRTLRCEVDASTGGVDVPVELLEQLEAGTATFTISAMDKYTQDVGGYEVTVRLVALSELLTVPVE
jgi:hypothetical protein